MSLPANGVVAQRIKNRIELTMRRAYNNANRTEILLPRIPIGILMLNLAFEKSYVETSREKNLSLFFKVNFFKITQEANFC